MPALVSRSIAKTSAGSFAGATSTAQGSFSIRVKAVGSDITFGTQAASTTFAFGIYRAGVLATPAVSTSTSFTIPSGVVTSGLSAGQAFKLQENNEVTIPVDFLFVSRTSAGSEIASDNYAIGLENVKWSATGNDTQTSSFMAGKVEWRTSTVVMP